jgi:hypothetical protein
MSNNNSKKQSIYKPTSGKRLSKKRIYKLLKKDKMNGGGMLDGLSAFFGGDPEKDESKSSDEPVEPPSPVEPSSDEPVEPPSPVEPSSDEPVVSSSEETVETPSVQTSSKETDETDETNDPLETDDTPSVETSSGEPESNIDGQGNLDNSLSVTDNKEGSSLFGTALETAKGVGNTISNSVSNTAEEVSAAVTDVNENDDEDNEDNEDNEDGDAGDGDAGDGEDKNLTEIIAAQNVTINNQNTTINDLNKTIENQSAKLVEVLLGQIKDLKQNTTNNNTIQSPTVNPSMSMGSHSMSPDTNSPMSIGSPSMSIDNMDSQAKRPGVGGKTKGRRARRRSTKKRRSK